MTVVMKDASTALKLHEAGFGPLIPVIPPGAKLSPGSKIRPAMLGKVPGKKSSQGWYGFGGWQNYQTREKDPERWDKWGANIGLLATNFPAVDIDVDDEQLAKVCEKFAKDFLGHETVPVRLSRGERRLLVYRTSEPFPRRALHIEYKGTTHTVEVLCEGRQYLVHGTHPSGAKYRWRDLPLWEVSPGDLPFITEQEVLEYFDALTKALAAKGITCYGRKSKLASDGPPPPQEELRAPSMEELAETVARIPNTTAAFPERDDYIAFGHAVKAAAGEHDAEGLGIFLEWCDRWDGGVNDPDQVEDDWSRMRAPFRIGWERLREYSGDTAQDEFEVLAEAPPPAAQDPFLVAMQAARALGKGGAPSPEALEDLHDALEDIAGRSRRIVEAFAVGRLKKVLGSEWEARQLLRAYAPPDTGSAFESGPEGTPVLQVLRPTDIHTEATYLVAGRIPSASVGAIIADFSLGKTWLTVDLGLSVAFGRPWLGAETTGGPVVFLIAEGNHSFPERIFAWLVERGLLHHDSTVEEMFRVLGGRVTINRHPARFDDPAFDEGIATTIRRTGARLLVIDTLGKTLGPEQGENDNDVANQITGMLSAIAARTGCASVVTHHVGHGDQGRARGASAWEQGMDFVYLIDGKREDLEGGKAVTLKPRKMRAGRHPLPTPFRLKPLPGLALRAAGITKPHVFDGAVVEAAVAEMVQLGLDAELFRNIEAHPGCTSGTLRVATGRRREDVKRVLDELAARGAIENRGSAKGHRWFAAAGWCVNGAGEVEDLEGDFPVLEGPTASVTS